MDNEFFKFLKSSEQKLQKGMSINQSIDEQEIQNNMYFKYNSNNDTKKGNSIIVPKPALMLKSKRLSIECNKKSKPLNEDEDISRIKQLSLLTAGARYQMMKINQQLLNMDILRPNVLA